MENNEKEQLNRVYPSNSRNNKREPVQQEKVDDKKLHKVVQGKVMKKKKGIGSKLAETFLEDDTKSVASYIFHDVLIPAAKSMISDMVGGGIEMLLFGGRRGRTDYSRGGSSRGPSRTSYGSYYRDTNRDSRDRDRDRSMSNRSRARFDFDEIVLETRGEAEEVISNLVDLTIDYQQATVADLYELVGITGNFTDNKYGWTDLRGVVPRRVRDGYLLDLPRPQPLD